MISIIICSKNQTLLKQVSKNIESTIGADYELIVINNSSNEHSLSQAYNKGARQATHEYLLFVHEDLVFHTEDWGRYLVKHLEDPEIALVGVLGCTIKSKCPSGVWVPVEGVNRMNHLQGKPDGRTEKIYENPFDEPVSEVAVLDGMFLATRKEYWEQKPFDEDLLKGFHGYDIDFSLSQRALELVWRA
jgi:glycosyltransferase involved in cell wall biosynthesis